MTLKASELETRSPLDNYRRILKASERKSAYVSFFSHRRYKHEYAKRFPFEDVETEWTGEWTISRSKYVKITERNYPPLSNYAVEERFSLFGDETPQLRETCPWNDEHERGTKRNGKVLTESLDCGKCAPPFIFVPRIPRNEKFARGSSCDWTLAACRRTRKITRRNPSTGIKCLRSRVCSKLEPPQRVS